jgi:murein DD-endopeptidase MepM/ murein hydrolase activator NlpD
MTKLSAPYKGCRDVHITQGWKEVVHPALDIAKFDSRHGMGEPLTAPEDVTILRISGETLTTGHDAIKNGYGVYMKGLETGLVHLYWHTYPVFPVKVGETVKRGKIVAFMSNSGYVVSGGKYVPIESRLTTHDGTHLHWEVMAESYVIGKKKPFVNYTGMIDWTLQPTYTWMDQKLAILKTVLKARQLLDNK